MRRDCRSDPPQARAAAPSARRLPPGRGRSAAAPGPVRERLAEHTIPARRPRLSATAEGSPDARLGGERGQSPRAGRRRRGARSGGCRRGHPPSEHDDQDCERLDDSRQNVSPMPFIGIPATQGSILISSCRTGSRRFLQVSFLPTALSRMQFERTPCQTDGAGLWETLLKHALTSPRCARGGRRLSSRPWSSLGHWPSSRFEAPLRVRRFRCRMYELEGAYLAKCRRGDARIWAGGSF